MCGTTSKCDGSGGCINKTWCDSQTIPSGVNVADYQCVDFDRGTLPSAWTLKQVAGGMGAISSMQASSAPNSFYSLQVENGQGSGSAAALTWNGAGSAAVKSVTLGLDIWRVSVKGVPIYNGGWIDEFCVAIGSARACFNYEGINGFGVAYSSGGPRLSCGGTMDLYPNRWNHMELQISSTGPVELRGVDGAFLICNNDGTTVFPSSVVGSAAVGLESVGSAAQLDAYVDNVVLTVRR